MNTSTARAVAGYGTAFAMTPYLIVKIGWTVAGLRGDAPGDGPWDRLDWVLLNALTVGMAGAAILLGLLLARPWGLRAPGWVTLLPAWIGMGFLVPMLPVIPLLLLLSPASGGATPAAGLPAWEGALLTASFAGFGLGVAVAFPLYARERWPQAFGSGLASPPSTGPRRTAAQLATVAGVTIGLPQLYWALGGTVGLDPANLGRRDAQWHLFVGNTGLWALIAAWGVWTVTHRRAGPGSRRRLLVTWVASGFLFAWGTWKAVLTYAVVEAYPPPEPPWVLALENHFGALTGAVILLVLTLVIADRRQAPAAARRSSATVVDAG